MDHDHDSCWKYLGEKLKMPTGTVKRVIPSRRYGFISGDDGGTYWFHFAHRAEVTRFAKGDRVEFEIANDAAGGRASSVIRVRRIAGAA